MSLRAGFIAGLAVAGIAAFPAAGADVPVDLELVLAVDVSRSMTLHELEIQRRGYAAALTSEEVLSAITGGGYGRIAVTYVEWAGAGLHNTVVGWTEVSTRAQAEAVALRLSASAANALRRTSISGAIDFAGGLFEGNGFAGLRKVIDISGDGPNNDGRPVTSARGEAVARGIVINGLPLMTSEGIGTQWYLDDLDVYYSECVIGGTGAFMIPVREWADFPEAVRRKLVLEIAGTVQVPSERVQAVPAAGYDCLVGEKIWRSLFEDRY